MFEYFEITSERVITWIKIRCDCFFFKFFLEEHFVNLLF